MAAPIATLRHGAYLTRERMRLVALAVLLASAAGLIALIVTAQGWNDFQGRPLGTDFSNIYAAGTHVLDGRPDAPFDPALQHAREQALFGTATPFYGWHYPPFFLFVAAALALLPYPLALAVWQFVTLALYLWAIRGVVRFAAPVDRARDHLWLLLALAFPAVFVNLGHGHNGFLTAALFAGALVLLDARPAIAGLLFGLLAYKPQFGLLIPLVLAATGRWRSFAAAAATVGVLALLASIAFGPKVWQAFLDSMPFTRTHVLEAGETGWHKIQSVFAVARMWGAGIPLAYLAQGAVTVAVSAASIWLWRSGAAFALKAAALPLAALLATPYSLDYDMMALAVTIAFLAADGMARGFAPYEKTILAALWLVPLVARSAAEHLLVPLGVIAMLAAFALILRRAASEPRVLPDGIFRATA